MPTLVQNAKNEKKDAKKVAQYPALVMGEVSINLSKLSDTGKYR